MTKYTPISLTHTGDLMLHRPRQSPSQSDDAETAGAAAGAFVCNSQLVPSSKKSKKKE